MKTDAVLQSDVQKAIRWEPLLDEAEIGVTVKDGVVTLSGYVDSYVKKMEAENATKRVIGVRALAENIKVKFARSFSKTDGEIASEVLLALKRNWSIPSDNITVKVEDGWVTLDGELKWNYQKEAAQHAVHDLAGVKGVDNNIRIKSSRHDAIEKKDIEHALKRSTIDDSKIKVSVSDDVVTLSGTVDSWYQKGEAGRITWNTPGVCHVKNDLDIDYEMDFS
ncbi:BON domain-containing protein [Sphingobacterium sp. JUb56]|uniref:BON domain-containing protein n=1 Tax=Sphingobacterium sp. JUb56 TaxID=2587145 RepID=UPI00160BA9B3|nr:BON domain-containing protein [Sphingobacterium sp. JUb56]MBB2950611.1 osmotically-inducible protein OsmY [Sphingobacterium sp. JUb56]